MYIVYEFQLSTLLQLLLLVINHPLLLHFDIKFITILHLTITFSLAFLSIVFPNTFIYRVIPLFVLHPTVAPPIS
jgi:hypothetical protein